MDFTQMKKFIVIGLLFLIFISALLGFYGIYLIHKNIKKMS